MTVTKKNANFGKNGVVPPTIHFTTYLHLIYNYTLHYIHALNI